MTLFPKNIASNAVIFKKYQYRFRYLIAFTVLLITGFLFRRMSSDLFFGLLGLLMLATFIHQMGIPFNRQVLDFCEEVVDNNTGLTIKKNGIYVDIAYKDIVDIDYFYAHIWLNCRVVKLILKPNLQRSNMKDKELYFISWADYNLSSRQKSKETLAWIKHIKNKIKEQPSCSA